MSREKELGQMSAPKISPVTIHHSPPLMSCSGSSHQERSRQVKLMFEEEDARRHVASSPDFRVLL